MAAPSSSGNNPAAFTPSADHEGILLPFQNLCLASKSFSDNNYLLPSHQSHNNLNLAAPPLMSSPPEENQEQWRRITQQQPLPTLPRTPGNLWAPAGTLFTPRTENNSHGECSSSWNRQLGDDRNIGYYDGLLVAMAKTQRGSMELNKWLRSGNRRERQEIVDGVIIGGCIFEVMVHRYGHRFFISLLDFCDSVQLHAIFVTLTADRELFLSLSLLKHGFMVLAGQVPCRDSSRNLKGQGWANVLH
ncbi:unnamed protein product [Cuscuta campestris]|uniref:Uncharacterized protein n=1 Tax=Cuscuta campestris TaxID=132261 RepID=A0A484KA67_9ASTE|nr:unnamed protein product [Cuscuta campestris]